jgi:two-component system nitrogen regulation response regulator NtrX
MLPQRILIADDDQVSRETIADFLQDEGYEVHFAANGHEAVAALAVFQPELVLTDLHMPGLSGLDVLQHVRTVFPQTLVFICTSETAIEVMQTAQQLGAHAYVNKPLNLDEMLLRIEQAFGTSRQK